MKKVTMGIVASLMLATPAFADMGKDMVESTDFVMYAAEESSDGARDTVAEGEAAVSGLGYSNVILINADDNMHILTFEGLWGGSPYAITYDSVTGSMSATNLY